MENSVNFLLAVPDGLRRGDAKIRMAGTSEQPLTCLIDFAEAFGIECPRSLTKALKDWDPDCVDTINAIDSMGRMRETTFVTEGALYYIVMNSRKDWAVKWQKWLLNEVMPSIRKYGCYPAPVVSEDPGIARMEEVKRIATQMVAVCDQQIATRRRVLEVEEEQRRLQLEVARGKCKQDQLEAKQEQLGAAQQQLGAKIGDLEKRQQEITPIPPSEVGRQEDCAAIALLIKNAGRRLIRQKEMETGVPLSEDSQRDVYQTLRMRLYAEFRERHGLDLVARCRNHNKDSKKEISIIEYVRRFCPEVIPGLYAEAHHLYGQRYEEV